MVTRCVVLSVFFAFLSPLMLAGQEPTCDHSKRAAMEDSTKDAFSSSSFKVEGRRLLWEKTTCPSSADVCRKYWWDIFGWFTRYTLRELDGCASKCTSHLDWLLNNGWVCDSDILDCKGRKLFDKGGLDDAVVSSIDNDDASNEDKNRGQSRILVQDLVKDLKGNIEGSFEFKENILVFPEKMDQLIQFIDKTLKETLVRGAAIDKVPIENDFQFDITTEILKTLIGMENIHAVYKFYQEYDPGFPVSRITLRRVDFADTEVHLDWHVDGESNMVTHVFLNEVEEGGNYLFVGPDGQEEVVAHKGTALVHGQNVIHGIESFRGRRYTLLFVGDNREAKDVIKELIEKEKMKGLMSS